MKIKTIVEHPLFSNVIMVLIVLNAITIGLETYPSVYKPYSEWFRTIDLIILGIFIVEILLKLMVYKMDYFRDGWNLLDFGIVALSLLFIQTNLVSILRIVRILRVLRTISAFPSLRRLVRALFMSFPAMGSTLFLIGVLFYIYAVIGTTFFSAVAPDYFGNLQFAVLTLFQVFTLEAWASEVFRPIFDVVSWSWMYFFSFILLTSYIFVNLFFGELVSNAQKLSEDVKEDNQGMDDIKKELAVMKERNELLHSKLDQMADMLMEQDKEKVG